MHFSSVAIIAIIGFGIGQSYLIFKRDVKQCTDNQTLIQDCGNCTGYSKGCGVRSHMIRNFDCPPSNCTHSKPRCICKPNYVLASGKCILSQDCPLPCPPNEHQIGGDCEKGNEPRCQVSCSWTSADIELDNTCSVMCDGVYCVCDHGYVRDDETFKCIKKEECPPT